MSLAQGSYCKQKNLDPEDPRCAHLILSGRFMPVNVKNHYCITFGLVQRIETVICQYMIILSYLS